MNDFSAAKDQANFVMKHNNSFCNTATDMSNEYLEKASPPNPRKIYADCILRASESQKSSIKSSMRCKCTPLEWFLTLFPIFSWLPKYNWRTDLSFDLVAGTTICVMHIPQGMAYALLGNLQPIIGIYMAFFPIIVYSFMGTSRHVSMGTFAVVCLMTGKVATERMASYAAVQLKLNDSALLSELYLTDDETTPGSPYTSEQIATVISFSVGIWQILMGTLRLGSLSVLLSAELVSGFTTGAAVHVLTSQIRNLLGLSLPRRNGLFKIPLTYVDIMWNFGNINVTAVLFSVFTISSLVIFNEVLKPIAARKIPFPIPIELFTIIIGTLVSKYWITSKEYGFPIVNHIPTGLPTPSLPPIEILPDVIVDSFVIALVAFVISVSMAKIFAIKHNYQINPNQELIANGTSNFVGSLFMCAPISASLSRSLIQEQVGGKSQIAGLFSCSLIVIVLLWIGPFFETLPHCVLSAMIVVALKGMFLQFLDLPKAYNESLLNAVVWVAAFIATVLLDIEYGLGVGLIFSICTLIFTSNKPHINVLGTYADSNVYVDASMTQAKEIPGIKIVKYTGSLNFATIELFVEKLQLIIPPTEPKRKKGANNLGGIIVSTISKEKINDNVSIDDNLCDFHPAMVQLQESISWIILDFSSVSSIDPAGVKALKSLTKTYLKKDIQLIFVGCAPSLFQVMERCELLSQAGIEHFFSTVHDAVTFCCVPNFEQINNNANQAMSPDSINIDCVTTNVPYQVIQNSIFEKIPNNT
ncbi:prestin isoform X2 [Folsomia candida]|nr:prestin isoform X2 [Folsomia candida]XP_035705268.1 prestin isoform X2 [Folsomia candida]